MAWNSKDDLEDIYNIMSGDGKVQAIHLRCDNPSEAFKSFQEEHKVIEAAGGFVQSAQNRFLFIERLGYWDLPKGKVDEGESIAKAAMREVEEECGVSNLTLQEELPTTYHTYEHKGKRILKPTYWFSMSIQGEPKLTAQTEEGITQAVWLSQADAKELCSKMYASIWDLSKTIFSRPKP